MQIQAVKIRRSGGEDDSNAQVVVEIQDMNGEWQELGREVINSNFSSTWSALNGESFGDYTPPVSRVPFSDEKW